MESARKERPFLRGRWYYGSEGCEFHNSAMNVSCCYCGTGRDGAATVADCALLSPLAPPSRHGKGSPSLAGTPGPSPLAAASTLLSNQGSIFDKDDKNSSTTLQSRRLSEGGINTPADPPGSDTSEREGSLMTEHSSRRQLRQKTTLSRRHLLVIRSQSPSTARSDHHNLVLKRRRHCLWRGLSVGSRQ